MANEIVGAERRLQHEPEPAPTSTLCSQCFHLLSEKDSVQDIIKNGYHTFYRTWDYLLAETRKGCELCTMISSKITFLKHGPLKSDRISDEVIARIMKFELSDARGRRRNRGQEGNAKDFSGLEGLKIEICVGEQRTPLADKEKREPIEDFNVSAIDGIDLLDRCR